ncbi:CRISPR-associated protein Cas4 [Thermococcus chitonophagus]|uniref:CRISPR-associated exonuclease Cas4 n=1 Tax=Thermococcus chitonophagus TaxID=54262 RepID=A0A160VQH0_9EURY|nr:CRISPR-associated protein Cas4 [Thermococcus chitonophagus]ASJ15758.1 CRISPR-associated protein Cas4 [Thermococcus chitonophagus]CUX76982.1 CRISPR-associated RecB family exonuclease Cas4a [Thermococcus chitonophagus]
MRVTGLMIQYYFTCKRELWFFSRGVNFDFENDDMIIGKIIHEEAREGDWKEILLEDIKIDAIKRKGGLRVIEIKKSSKLEEPAKWQLKYYLYYLKKAGIEAVGIISYPKEGRQEEIKLTREDIRVLEDAIKEIEEIIASDKPPKAVKKPYCKKCSYKDFCWV